MTSTDPSPTMRRTCPKCGGMTTMEFLHQEDPGTWVHADGHTPIEQCNGIADTVTVTWVRPDNFVPKPRKSRSKGV